VGTILMLFKSDHYREKLWSCDNATGEAKGGAVIGRGDWGWIGAGLRQDLVLGFGDGLAGAFAQDDRDGVGLRARAKMMTPNVVRMEAARAP